MANSDRRRAVECYVDAYNRFDVDGMLAGLSEDVVFENLSDGEVTASSHGIEEFRRLAELSRAMFSQREQTITAWEFRSMSVRVAVAWQGVLAVEMPQGPAIGTVLKMCGESEFQFRNERICRIVDCS